MTPKESLLALLAVPLGLMLWLFLYGVSGLSQAIGPALRAIVYLAPLGLTAPLAWHLLKKARFGSGLLLIAGTPVLSGINLLIFIGASGGVAGSDFRKLAAAILLWLLWQSCWILPLAQRGLALRSQDRKERPE